VQFIEAARFLAERVLQKGGDKDDDRLDFLAKRILARPLRAEELPIVKSSLADLVAHYQQHPDDAKKLIAMGESKPAASIDASLLAAWTMVANQLLNLDEALNK
jgi:hypothetical protein